MENKGWYIFFRYENRIVICEGKNAVVSHESAEAQTEDDLPRVALEASWKSVAKLNKSISNIPSTIWFCDTK